MLKESSTKILEGNDRFEGFGIDIIDELSKMYGFKYIFVEQEDKDYGSLIDNSTQTYSGILGKIRSGVRFVFV